MYPRNLVAVILGATFLFTVSGCATPDGGSGGWVVVGQPESSPPPPPSKHPPSRNQSKAEGQERAARNHIRSAYRFLEKGKPDHALKELEKARKRMGDNFWFHYYAGGAYYFKGMYREARESWHVAYSHTWDYRLMSRIRTCQSFAVNHLEGDESSIGFLKNAIEKDAENRQARELLEDLTGPRSGSSHGEADVQVGFMNPSDGRSGRDDSRDDDRQWGAYDDDKGGSRGKGDRHKDESRGKKPPKKEDRNKKIRDKELFRFYFLIEMP